MNTQEMRRLGILPYVEYENTVESTWHSGVIRGRRMTLERTGTRRMNANWTVESPEPLETDISDDAVEHSEQLMADDGGGGGENMFRRIMRWIR